MQYFDDIVNHMKSLAEYFIPYNFPKVPPKEEDEINILKFREAMVDGYNVILHYNKHNYGNHFFETFQVLGKEIPFLPFCLTCKLAKKFLGDDNLSLVEILKDNRKIYCWTVIKSFSGKSLKNYKIKGENCIYEGLTYSYILPDKVNFY